MSSAAPQDRKQHMDASGAALMVFLTFVWGTNAVTGKLAVGGLDPFFLSLGRAVVGGLAVLAWCRFKGIRIFTADGTLKSGLFVGMLFGIEFALIYVGLSLTSASRANLMTNTMPIFTLIGSHFLLGEKATPVKIAGTVLSFIGVFIVFFDELSLPSPTAIYGDLLCILAGAMWAATGLGIRMSKMGRAAPEKTLLYQLLGAGLVALPFLPFADVWVKDGSALVWGSFLYQSLFVVAFTYVLWFWMMTRYPLTALSAYTFLSTVFGVLASGIALGEPLTPGLIGGMALVVAGIILVNLNRGPKTGGVSQS